MFPAFLREAGYYTTNNSKEDCNVPKGDKVWHESSGSASWQNRPSEDISFFHFQTYTGSHESRLHFSRKWMRNHETKTDLASIATAPYHPDTELFRFTYARYYERMRMIDDRVGAMVKK